MKRYGLAGRLAHFFLKGTVKRMLGKSTTPGYTVFGDDRDGQACLAAEVTPDGQIVILQNGRVILVLSALDANGHTMNARGVAVNPLDVGPQCPACGDTVDGEGAFCEECRATGAAEG